MVLGAGGIGGSIGARLHQAEHDVALIARGAHGEAIRERGLTFERPEERVTLRIPAYSHPSEVTWRDDGHVAMTGPAALSFEGTVDLSRLAGPA